MKFIKIQGVYYNSPDYKLMKHEAYINIDRIDEITVANINQLKEHVVYSIRINGDCQLVISKALDELIAEAR